MSGFRDRVSASVERSFRHVSEPGVFTSGEQTLDPVATIRDFTDAEGLGEFVVAARQEANAIALLRSEVSERPQTGDRIARDDGVFIVREQAVCLDRFQLIWVCRVREETPAP